MKSITPASDALGTPGAPGITSSSNAPITPASLAVKWRNTPGGCALIAGDGEPSYGGGVSVFGEHASSRTGAETAAIPTFRMNARRDTRPRGAASSAMFVDPPLHPRMRARSHVYPNRAEVCTERFDGELVG